MPDTVQIVPDGSGRWALLDACTRQPVVLDGIAQINLSLQRAALVEDAFIQRDRALQVQVQKGRARGRR